MERKNNTQIARCFFLIRYPKEKTVQLYKEDKNSSGELLINSFNEATISHAVSKVKSVSVKDLDTLDLDLTVDKSYSKKDISKKDYIQFLEETLETLKKTKLSKVITSRTKKVPFSSKETLGLYKKLCSQNTNAYVFLLKTTENRFWIGASPELLLKIKDGKLYTTSLAGTKFSLKTAWMEKEYEEQKIVTDFIHKKLRRHCTNINLAGPETIKTGEVFHLKTTITADIKDEKDITKILNGLNPTPAVCGHPRELAKEYITKKETHKRELYTGYIGIKNKNELESFVNLRCAQIFKDALVVYVGGGITASSKPQDEWEETEQKANTILNQLKG